MNKRRLTKITSCSITRDISQETLGNAQFESNELLGEMYVRVYAVVTQNKLSERYALGTFIIQTPGKKWDGKKSSYSLDAYTPLLELKDDKPPLGYTVKKNRNIMETVSGLLQDNTRLPFVPVEDDKWLEYDYVAEEGDTWLSYLSGLLAKAEYSFNLDEMGVIYFEKRQDVQSLTPLWTYMDDEISILYPDISIDDDIYGVPNKCTVVYTNEGANMECTVVNDRASSPISTVNRNRVVFHREMNPDFGGKPTESQLKIYTENLLESLSTINDTITYSHGFTPPRLYDAVRIHHRRGDMLDIKARVTSQKITCTKGLKVDETAEFTKKLWKVDE